MDSKILPDTTIPEKNIMQESDVINRRYYALMAMGIILPFLLTPFLSVIFLSHDQSFTYRLTCSRFLIWGVLGIMVLYARLAEVQKFFLWADEAYGFSFYLVSVFALYLVVFAGGIIAHIPFWLGVHENNTVMHNMQHTMGQYPALLAFTALTAAITEEFIFRGYILTRLSLFFSNEAVPVIISAALFASVHLGYRNVSEIIFTFLFGLTFGFFYQKYRTIKPLIIVHFLVDIFAGLPALHHK